MLSYIAQFLLTIEDYIEDYYCIDKKITEEDRFEIQSDLDIEINNAEVELLAHTAFIPEKIFKKLEKFKDKLFDSNLLSDNNTLGYDIDIASLDGISDHLFFIAEAKRKDLGIDSLNIKLKKRTHPKKKRK